MHDIGLVSVSFREYSPEEIVAESVKAGLSCIEWGSDIHAPCRDQEKLTRIKALQEQAGLYCCSYGTYFRLGQTDLEELEDYLQAARYLGTRIVRLWCGTKGSAEYPPEELEQLYDVCRKAAALAEKENMVLCMECHNNTLTDTGESALSLMKAVDSPAFRMYYQPNQYRTEEDNLTYARLLTPYIHHIHVFDWKYVEQADAVERYPLRHGINAWKKYLEVLPQNGCLLLEFMPDNRLNSLCREAHTLKELSTFWKK